MNEKARTRLPRAVPKAVLTLLSVLLLAAAPARAANQFVSSGGTQNASGGWTLPNGGYCGAGSVQTAPTTRGECVATFFTASTTSAACKPTAPAIGGTWVNSATTTAFCIDTVNNTQAACVNVPPGGTYNGQTWPQGIQRVWNTNGAASACFLTYKGYDRNKVTCANQGGTYTTLAAYNGGALLTTNSGVCVGAWNFPLASTYTPVPITIAGTSQASSVGGDQCLRCHRNDTQWNVNVERWVDPYLKTGHKNMARRVPNATQIDQNGPAQVGFPWAGTNGVAYPSDSSGNAFDWLHGLIQVAGSWTQAYWIYDGWFESPFLPSAIYSTAPVSGKPGVSYSCGRCHTTGWTSDSAIGPSTGNLAKEPEKSFPGVSWDGVTGHATTGQVNLAGGVAGDPNMVSSWDLYGISCSKCHGVAVDNTSHGGVPPFTTAANYGGHNNGFTGTSSGSGYCSVPDMQNSAACTAAGGTWLTTACSDGVSLTQGACVAAGKTWTFASCSTNSLTSTAGTLPVNGLPVPQAYCSAPTPSTSYATSAACIAVAGAVWTDVTSTFGTSGACTGAGYTWDGVASKCNTCYVPNGKTAVACAAQNVSPLSTTFTNAYATDVDSCVDAGGGQWTDNKTQRGQIITSVCLGCHRQENKGLPYTNGSCSVGYTGSTGYDQGACVAAGGTWTDNGGGLPVLVGAYHSTVTFPSHKHGNEYANSPHGKYTGKFANLATAPFGYGGPNIWGSFFIGGADGDTANLGSGCTGCHNVHKSTNETANPAGEAVKQCNDCHHKNLALINHPSGPSTPLYNLADPVTACAKCHMPGGEHFFRINADPSYKTFPAASTIVSGVNVPANTAPDGTFTNAVWIDLDLACGQCHGGGTSNVATTGTVAKGSASLTVANASGLLVNEKIRVAGAYSYKGLVNGVATYADLDSYITAINGNTVTLAGTAGNGVTNAVVTQNATSSSGSYFTKAQLATYAAGIHNDKPVALFTAMYGADGSTVNVDASASNCSGSLSNCAVFDWNWGDATAHGSGVTSSHSYTTPGTYTITLTVTQYGFAPGIATRSFVAYAVANPPSASGTCTVDYTTWIASCGGVNQTGIALAEINWGDGTVVSNITGGTPPFTHTFLLPGTYSIKLTVTDSYGQRARATLATTVAASFQYYTVAGTVFAKDGVTPLSAAQIQLKQGAVLKRQVTTAANGTYNTGNLKPGTYTVFVSKTGYTFASPAGTLTIGPSLAGQNFTATGP